MVDFIKEINIIQGYIHFCDRNMKINVWIYRDEVGLTLWDLLTSAKKEDFFKGLKAYQEYLNQKQTHITNLLNLAMYR